MIKTNYLSYLLCLIKTKSHSEEIITKLDELKESLYNKRIDLDKKMGELFSYDIKEKIKALSWQEQVNLNDPEAFGRFLVSLRTQIKNMPVIAVKIAFESDEEIVSQICDWFVENYGKNVLLDVQTDKRLIGGAVIIFNKTEKDFSLKKKINDKYKPEHWQEFVRKIRIKPAQEVISVPQEKKIEPIKKSTISDSITYSYQI